MGRRRYPPLKPSEVVAILDALGFVKKRQDGSHAQYERVATSSAPVRAVVTVDMSISSFSVDLMQSMVRQSCVSREGFYGATSKTKKKI
jgi:predicted RNA binding protein YcfA (HicA-like mRNA interferase family)